VKSLELLEAQQVIAALRAEVRRLDQSERQKAWYINTQMHPLVVQGIKQAGEIKTLQRRLQRRDDLIARLKTRLAK
jgi:hypothetical protein